MRKMLSSIMIGVALSASIVTASPIEDSLYSLDIDVVAAAHCGGCHDDGDKVTDNVIAAATSERSADISELDHGSFAFHVWPDIGDDEVNVSDVLSMAPAPVASCSQTLSCDTCSPGVYPRMTGYLLACHQRRSREDLDVAMLDAPTLDSPPWPLLG